MKRVRPEVWVLLGILVVVALLLRITHVAESYVKTTPFRADAGEYAKYAENLERLLVFSKAEGSAPEPDSFRSPGYPTFLAATRLAGGESGWFDLARYAQAVLGAAMVPLVFLLGLAFLPAWAAVVAAALTALSPHLVTSTGYILTETLFGSLLLGAVGLLTMGLRRGRSFVVGAAGLVLGAGVMVNESAVLLGPAFAGTILLFGERGRRLKPAVLFLGIFLLLPASWQYRNSRLSADAPSGGQRALITLTHGTYPGFVHEDPERKYYPYQDDPEQPEYGASWETFRRVFWSRVKERPLRYLTWYLFEKPYHLWGFAYLQGTDEIYVYPTGDSPYEEYPAVDLTRVGMKYLHPLLVVLALLALPLWWVLRKRRALAATPALCLVAMLVFTLVGMVFAPWPRYVVPLRPLLYLAALWPVAVMFSRRSGPAARPEE